MAGVHSLNERDHHCSLFRPKNLHFFKILLEETIRAKKLLLPKRFVRKHGTDLSNSVILKVPSGATWQVELFKCDDEVWLHNGWQEFADYFCLEYGDFLVFEYEGNSQFSVIIFDPSATEIDYPVCSIHDGKFREPKEEETPDDIPVEILGDFAPNPKKRGKSSFPCSHSQPSKVRKTCATGNAGRTNVNTDQFSKMTKKDSKRDLNFGCSTPQFEGCGGTFTTGQKFAKTGVISRLQQLAGNQMASTTLKHPIFSMNVTPKTRYVYVVRSLIEYHNIKLKEYIELCDENGTLWPVKLSFRKDGRILFSSGWPVFYRQNKLAVGDRCIFEFLLAGNNVCSVIQVWIVRKDVRT